MNNKILARLIAAVMAIAMLGTVSFAASLTSDVDANVTLDVTADTDKAYEGNNGVKTFIAYVADTADANPEAEDILAIVQNDDGAVPTTFDIDKDKLKKNYLVVRFGGNGTAVDKTIAFAGDDGEISFDDEIEVGGSTYTDVAYFAKDVTLEAGKSLTNYGFKVKNTAGVGNEFYFTDDVVLEAGEAGTYTFSILFAGVSAEQNAAWDVNAFYTIAE